MDSSHKLAVWKMLRNAKGDDIKSNDTQFARKDDAYYFWDKTVSRKALVYDTPVFNWINTPDTKVILGYTCKAATTFFRGRKYIAYYSPDLPHDFGPWKFRGLEGLILEVSTDDNTYSYIATKIDQSTKQLDLKGITNFISAKTFIDWTEYVKVYKEEIDTFIKNEQCNCNEDGRNILKITKIEKIYPDLHDTGIIY